MLVDSFQENQNLVFVYVEEEWMETIRCWRRTE